MDGKLGTPCLRTHCAHVSAARTSLADGAGGEPFGPPPGSSFLHWLWAALNAGDAGSTPEPGES